MTLTLFDNTSFKISKNITNAYSTSFSIGIKVFKPEYRDGIYAIYSYVRLADEIVDTFIEYDRKYLLKKFRYDTYDAIKHQISTNPVLHTFQIVVKKYNIGYDLIDAFLDSMEKDLYNSSYSKSAYDNYIYGSAEVVGLMCLKVFCKGDLISYNELLEPAKKLGSAFQKVNFLRDIKSDIEERGRIYLPDVNSFSCIDDDNKQQLEKEVELEFKEALKGILRLPIGVRLGVYTAYLYYNVLFKQIKNLKVTDLLESRVRVSNFKKLTLLIKSYFIIKIYKAEPEW